MSEVTEQTDELEQDNAGQGDDQVSEYETTDGKPYADDFSNLSDERVNELRSICSAMDERDQWARMIEIIRCTLRRYFFLGQQHPYWNSDAGMFQVGPSGVTLGDENENQEEFFEEEFNLYKSYAEVFMSVFSQTAAPTRMEPSNLSGEAMKATKEAEKYVDVYEKFNPAKCAQLDVARLMWTDGRIVAETAYEVDEEKCGVDENGNPLGSEITKYWGVLESKCPIVGEFKAWPYCKLSREMDITIAKDRNPRIAQKLDASAKGQVPNSEVARMSRIAVDEGIAQVSSDTLEYLITEDRWYLRPAAFRHLDRERQAFWIGGETKNEDGTTEKIEGIFPKGCRARFFGTVFAGAKPMSMDSRLKVMHTNPGTGNARGSKSDSLVPVQMEFNDGMGMYSELIHKAIPSTWLAMDAADLAAVTEQFSRYGEYHPFDPENGKPLSENIFQETQVDVPASFPIWLQNLQGALPQMLANIQPAMFGGNMDDQKTAKAYQQAKDMSLGVMALVWVPYLEFAAGIRWQAARLAAERDQEKISAVLDLPNGRTKSVSIDTSVLGRGGYLCKPVTDMNFPESHTDIANKWLALWQVVPTNPVAQNIFQEPDNLAAFRDATGLKIVIKGAVARDKQLAEWEMMQQGDGPVPDLEAEDQANQANQQQAQAAIAAIAPGQQAPPVPEVEPIMKSSVPTRLADDHIEEARTCVRILNDPKTLDMLEDEPEKVEDLELHLKEHLTKAQAGGIMIPPDLAGILPAPPVPPVLPGAPGAAPGAPGAPGAPAHPPKGAAAGPVPPPVPAPTNAAGGPNALATTT